MTMTQPPRPPYMSPPDDLPSHRDALRALLIAYGVSGGLPDNPLDLVPLGAPLLALASRGNWALIFALADPDGEDDGEDGDGPCWCRPTHWSLHTERDDGHRVTWSEVAAVYAEGRDAT